MQPASGGQLPLPRVRISVPLHGRGLLCGSVGEICSSAECNTNAEWQGAYLRDQCQGRARRQAAAATQPFRQVARKVLAARAWRCGG